LSRKATPHVAATDDLRMTALLETTDLLAAPQQYGPASQAGARVATCTPKQAIQRAGDPGVRLVLLELASPLGDVGQLVAGLKALPSAPAVVAFGPHVQEAKLQAATDAGCDAVLTRGQLYRQAGALIARYASPAAGDADDADDVGSV
ncbi:MAG: hypothetical protein AAF790_08055, partial [Planctomycetota bacterium]